jgi:exosortase/archaeosortase family protein
VTGTGIAAHYYGDRVAHGFLHSFSGWVVFGVALVLVLIVARVIHYVAPDRPDESPMPVVVS